MKPAVKNFSFPKRFFRLSLSARITMYFVLFGIIIGYLSYVINAYYATGQFIDFYRMFILRRLAVVTGGEEPDMLLRIINSQNPTVRAFAAQMRSLSIHSHERVDFGVYVHKTREGRWYRVIPEEKGVFREAGLSAGEAAAIDHSAGRAHFVDHAVPWGRHDDLMVKIDFTRSIDTNRYFMVAKIDRRGILEVIVENRRLILFFTAVLLAISFTLGHLFAVRLMKPVRELSDLSSLIASGEYERTVRLSTPAELSGVARSLNALTDRIRSDIDIIEQRMRAMITMNRIDKAVLSSISKTELLDSVVEIVSSLLPCSNIAIVIRDNERRGFELLSFREKNNAAFLSKKPFIDDAEIHDIIHDSYRIFFQMKNRPGFKLGSFFGRLVGQGVASLVNAPFYMYGEYMGSLIISSGDVMGYSEDQERTIMMLSDQVGVALSSIRMLEERENMLLGIMIALTRSIDAKSPWTAGHSERVARYSERIGVEMSLGQVEMRNLSLSALLHDVGKIAVPESILDKDGSLTHEEIRIVRKHPEVGAGIIGDIPAYKSIVPAIYSHHERWDGSGYPAGLAGEDIPLFARIISIADVFDAITDDRPYRRGMPPVEAQGFMERNAGIMFDPGIIEIIKRFTPEKPS
jgi:HD-GYP domain-containing protein (c-di-GMP phosphodiesterase class II)